MKRLVAAAAAIAFTAVAAAHPGHDEVLPLQPFWAGFAHPFGGLDHVLAMVAVGLWAAQRGGLALWAWPAAFVVVMLGGGALGLAGTALPGIEPAIAASIIVLGVMVALKARVPVLGGAALIGAFALFHGNAHGLEAPGGAAASFAAGFAVATGTLHAMGVMLGVAAARIDWQGVLRVGGALTAAAGAALLVG